MAKNRQTNNNNRDKPKRTEGKKRGEEIQQFHTKGTTPPIRGTEDQIIQNDLEYADYTQLLIESDTHKQLCGRIGNYDIAAATRGLKIQWGE